MAFRQIKAVTRRTLLCIGAAAAMAFAPANVALGQDLAEPCSSETQGVVSSWNIPEEAECVLVEEAAADGLANDSSTTAGEGAESGMESSEDQMQADEPGDLVLPEVETVEQEEPVSGSDDTDDDPAASGEATDIEAGETSENLSKDLSEQSEAVEANGQPSLNMYRLYNPNSGEHFYTSSLTEAQHVAAAG